MDKIEELLTRAVEKVYPSKEELEKELESGKKLKIYQGFDPTSPELHIGHLTGLKKLRQWQDLGHEVIFLIGDFTGMIGDPTGKDKIRTPLTSEQVLENAKTYKEQASKILDFEGNNPAVIKYNSQWLSKLTAKELLELSSLLTFQQVIERDMFQRRIENNQEISVSEFLYPLLQGYDSVAMDVDVEIGGSDQLFNMMIGRNLMHKIKRKNKYVVTTPLLTDSTGTKIGKTTGNAIALSDKPEDLYGKIMSLGDDIISKGFEYLTDICMDEIESIKKDLVKDKNPMEHKKRLAFEIVKELNSEEKANKAQEYFEKTVQEKEIPKDIPILELKSNEKTSLTDMLVNVNIASSKSEAKRLIEQGGVEVDNQKVTNVNEELEIKNNMIIKAGKRKFIKIKTT